MSYELPEAHRREQRVFVVVRMSDGTEHRGFVHVSRFERVQDMLNDGRRFIPLSLADGPQPALLLAKQYVMTIAEAACD